MAVFASRERGELPIARMPEELEEARFRDVLDQIEKGPKRWYRR